MCSSQSSPTVYYNSSQHIQEKIETDIEAGPFLRHEYVIKNLGPSDVVTADVLIEWPWQTTSGEALVCFHMYVYALLTYDLWTRDLIFVFLFAGDDLLYLFAQPVAEGNIKCERVTNVNQKQLQVGLLCAIIRVIFLILVPLLHSMALSEMFEK